MHLTYRSVKVVLLGRIGFDWSVSVSVPVVAEETLMEADGPSGAAVAGPSIDLEGAVSPPLGDEVADAEDGSAVPAEALAVFVSVG